MKPGLSVADRTRVVRVIIRVVVDKVHVLSTVVLSSSPYGMVVV